MEHTSNENIAAALSLLEEAARQKKDELKSVIADKYSHLRSLIMENETSLMQSLVTAKEHAYEAAAQVKEASVEKARELARGVDKNVHQNPYAYLAGVAVVGLLFGYILGRGRK